MSREATQEVYSAIESLVGHNAGVALVMIAVLILLGRHGRCARSVVKEWDLTPSLRAQIAGVIRVDMYGNIVRVFTTS